MSTAWEFLIQNSTIADDNIAWDHIQNQGGAGGGIIINRVDGIKVISSPIATAVVMEVLPTSVVVKDRINVVVEATEHKATVNNGIKVTIN